MTTKSASPAATGTSASEPPFMGKMSEQQGPQAWQSLKEATQEGGQARRQSRSQGSERVIS